MPAELLNEAGFAGFFGKLPTTGDFVGRGFPPAFRQNWDRWVTRHLLPRLGGGWPEGGLRFILGSGGRCAAGLILPSADSAGRRFPLTVAAILADGTTAEAVDAWCASALPSACAAVAGEIGADALWEALEAIPHPASGDTEAPNTLLMWRLGEPPRAGDPAAPEALLDALLPLSSA